MNEGPSVFLEELTDGIVLMIEEGEDPLKVINNINMVTGFYLQDRDTPASIQIN